MTPGPDPLPAPLGYPLAQHTLGNGLRVISSPDHQTPSVAVNIWYDVGSRHEEPGRTGFAHLFEHVMFQGSAHVGSGQHIALMQAAGASVNATTWFDRTNYFETLPTGGLDLALWLEADRMGSLLDALTQDNLDNQREVVKEEKRQRYDNVPYGDVMQRLIGLTFPADHPYGHTTIGSMDDLDAATLNDVQTFFATHYLPNNAVLSIVGDCDTETAFAKAEQYFGALPAGPTPADPDQTALPPVTGGPRAETAADVPADAVYLTWRLPAVGTGAFDALDLAFTVLGHGQTSRLYRALVRQHRAGRDGLGQHHGADRRHLAGPGLGPGPRRCADRAGRGDAGRRDRPAGHRRADPGGAAARQGAVRAALAARAGPDRLPRRRVLGVRHPVRHAAPGEHPGGRDLRRHAGRRPRRPAGLVRRRPADHPGLPEGGPMTDPLRPPPIAPPGPWHFPQPERRRLDNGLQVVAYRLPGQYVIAAHLVLDIPLNAEDPDQEGVATICARTLDEGTRSHAGEEFAELLETAGAGFGIDVTLSGVQTVLDVPASRLDQAFRLFAEAVIEPALAEADVERHVQLRLAEIEQAQANSAQVASIAYRRVVYDAATRASRMTGGESASVARVTPDAVRAFHEATFGPAGSTLVLAGDFGQDPFALAEQSFGGWANPGQQHTPHLPVGAGPRSALLVDRPGSVQADLRLGGFGPDRTDPRWADLTVGSYAMGGAFLSRLNAVLREEKGYTYGVRMAFSPLRQGGSYAVQGSFRTGVLADAVAEALRLLDIAGHPFSRREVDEAVSYFTGVSPLRYATADGVADQAATQLVMGLGSDYVDRSLADLRAVTPESATAAYRSVVDLDALSLVVVGEAAVLAEPLRGLGFDLQVVGARA